MRWDLGGYVLAYVALSFLFLWLSELTDRKDARRTSRSSRRATAAGSPAVPRENRRRDF